MLRSIKELFESVLVPAREPAYADAAHQIQLATAVLLVEVMRADAQRSDAEQQAVIGALRQHFELDADELESLVVRAQQAASEANDFFGFTSRLNDSFDMPQKIAVIEQMWRVAYADGTLSAHENHLMRKVADLLHVPHGAYVHAKMRARDQAGGDESPGGFP